MQNTEIEICNLKLEISKNEFISWFGCGDTIGLRQIVSQAERWGFETSRFQNQYTANRSPVHRKNTLGLSIQMA